MRDPRDRYEGRPNEYEMQHYPPYENPHFYPPHYREYEPSRMMDRGY